MTLGDTDPGYIESLTPARKYDKALAIIQADNTNQSHGFAAKHMADLKSTFMAVAYALNCEFSSDEQRVRVARKIVDCWLHGG